MARLILNHGSPQAQALDLQPGVNTIGRAPGNSFVIPDPTVSSAHCELVVSGIAVLVRDLGSTNGTFISGQPVKEAIIQGGQTLVLGKVPLIFQADEVQVSIPELSKPEVPRNALLDDGSYACLHHSSERAAWRCPKCTIYFCGQCVNQVGLQGGKKTFFCQECSVPCEPVSPSKPAKGRGFFKALGDTLKIRRR